MFRLILTILSLFVAVGLSAQITISGHVIEENGDVLIGANIIEKGTKNGVISYLEGDFQITVSDSTASLLISYTGYYAQEVLISDLKSLDQLVIAMVESYSDCGPIIPTRDLLKDLRDVYDVRLTKEFNATVNPGPYIPGDVVQLTISVANHGTIDAYDVDVLDSPPIGLSVPVLLKGQEGVIQHSPGRFTVFSVPALTTSTFEVVAVIDSTFKPANLMSNAEITNFGTNNLITEITIIPDQRSSSTVTQLNRPTELSVAGTADILSNAPGIFADASTGEVFSRVFSRGVSLSAEDDIGWFYNSLQEDGLPITMVNYNQFSPDLFHRPDISVRKTEIYKGGKSGILAANSPGAVVNFIGRTPIDRYNGETRLTSGFHQNGNAFLRFEGYSSGKFSDGDWGYDVSYWLRRDQGNRDIDYDLSNGIQAKLGLYRYFDNGLISLKTKVLSDQTNRYTGVAATNWENPEAAFGQSFQNTSLLPPAFAGEIPDGRTNGASSYESDPSNGIQTNEWSTTLSGDFQWEDWRLQFDSKISLKSAEWQTAIGGQPLGLDNFCLLYTSPSPRDATLSRMPSSA